MDDGTMEVSRARKMARPIVIEKPPGQPLLLPSRFAPLPPSFICTPYCFVESVSLCPLDRIEARRRRGRKKVLPFETIRCDGLCHPCYPCFSFIALYEHFTCAVKSFFSDKMSISNVIVAGWLDSQRIKERAGVGRKIREKNFQNAGRGE